MSVGNAPSVRKPRPSRPRRERGGRTLGTRAVSPPSHPATRRARFPSFLHLLAGYLSSFSVCLSVCPWSRDVARPSALCCRSLTPVAWHDAHLPWPTPAAVVTTAAVARRRRQWQQHGSTCFSPSSVSWGAMHDAEYICIDIFSQHDHPALVRPAALFFSGWRDTCARPLISVCNGGDRAQECTEEVWGRRMRLDVC